MDSALISASNLNRFLPGIRHQEFIPNGFRARAINLRTAGSFSATSMTGPVADFAPTVLSISIAMPDQPVGAVKAGLPFSLVGEAFSDQIICPLSALRSYQH